MSFLDGFFKSTPVEFLSKFSSPAAIFQAVSDATHSKSGSASAEPTKEEGITRELFKISGISFHVPVNYLEDFRVKVSAGIPAFYDRYLAKFKEVLGSYDLTKNVAAKIDPKSPKSWVSRTNHVMIAALSVMQQYYFITMGLYLMNIETIKLLADGKVKEGAANFVLGAVVYKGYFIFGALATIGMILRYYSPEKTEEASKEKEAV